MRKSHFLLVAIFLLFQYLNPICSARIQLKLEGTPQNDFLTVSLLNETTKPLILPNNCQLIFILNGLSSDESYISHTLSNFDNEKSTVGPDKALDLINVQLSSLKWSPYYWSNGDYLSTEDVLDTIIKTKMPIVIQAGFYGSQEGCIFHNYLSNLLKLSYSKDFLKGFRINFEEPTELPLNSAFIEIIEVENCVLNVRISNLIGKSEELKGDFEIQLKNKIGRPIKKCKIESNLISSAEYEDNVYRINLEDHFPNLKRILNEEDCLAVWIVFVDSGSRLQLESNMMRVGE